MFESFKIKRIENKIKLHELEQINNTLDVLESNRTIQDDDYRAGYRILDGNKAYYTEHESQEMVGAASKLYYTNPIAYGIAETIKNFTIGESMSITPIDESEEVVNFWDEFQKINKFDKRAKELCIRVIRDGEQFLRYFDTDDNIKVRFINATEIKNYTGQPENKYGIKCNDNDIEEPEIYFREFTDQKNSIKRETIPAEDITHTKIKVDSDVKRGVSFFTGIAPYLTKYKKWLDDRIELNRLRTVFNVVGKVTGSSSTSNVKSKLENTSPPDTSGIAGDTRKQMPKRGGVLLTKGVEWDLKNLNINAGDAANDGRSILLMITVGTNLAEYVVTGDTSNANYASTMVSESPMVKAFESWQDTFKNEFQEIYSKVIQRGINMGKIPMETMKTKITIDPDTGKELINEELTPTSLECEVNFPMLIHRDIDKETTSLTLQNANGWVSDRTCMEKFGYDHDQEKSRITKEELERSSYDSGENNTQEKEDFIKRQMLDSDIDRGDALKLWDSGQR